VCDDTNVFLPPPWLQERIQRLEGGNACMFLGQSMVLDFLFKSWIALDEVFDLEVAR
jgi:hypothetical protein